ncbi:MAG TPA: hypothetical protein VKV03_16535 [Candidatus Binataceae bacterium]|nr:hypothetical protein [Candidatus Binataceae bacterium]
MRSRSRIALLLIVSMLIPQSTLFALEPPRIIPHSAPINKPVDAVFQMLKGYFSDRLESKFELISGDEKADTIIAKQTGIDSERWRNWAACETDPLHIIYKLEDARVTITIKLEQAPHNTTFMTVSADFQGLYGLAQDQTTIECRSTGALEDSILALAGAQTPGVPVGTAPAH